MRTKLTLLTVLLATCFSSNHAAARTDPSIIERHYKGTVPYKLEKMQVTIERTMMLRKVYGSNKVTGTFEMAVTVVNNGESQSAGKTYISIGQVSGFYDPQKKELHVSIDSYNKADKLPDDVRWCKGKIVFKVSSRASSGYKLTGAVKDECKKEYEIIMEG